MYRWPLRISHGNRSQAVKLPEYPLVPFTTDRMPLGCYRQIGLPIALLIPDRRIRNANSKVRWLVFLLSATGSPGTAPRARSKLVVRSQYESPWTKVDSIEKERKGRRREQRHRTGAEREVEDRGRGCSERERIVRKRTGRRKLLRGLLRTSQSTRPQLGPPFCFISLRF